jgi:TolB-like protein
MLVGIAYWSWRHFRDATPPSSQKIRLAVLPFANLTGDPNKEYLADGLTEELIAPALNTLLGDPKRVFETSYAKMHQAIRALVKRGVESGDIRSDLDPVDLLRALIGVSNVASAPDWQPSARRLVDILIAGSRPAK